MMVVMDVGLLQT